MNDYRKQWFDASLEKVKDPPLNTDFNPVSYFYLWKLWFSMFASPGTILGAAFVVIALTIASLKVSAHAGVFTDPTLFASFALGFWGMAFEIAVMLVFQIYTGQLAWKFGLLFAVFMAGAASGAAFFRKIRASAALLAPPFIAVVISLTAYFYAEKWSAMRISSTFTACAAMLFAAGFSVGGYFPAAVNVYGRGHRIYSMDLWGAVAGGFLFSAVLVPLAGIKACFLISLAAPAAALAVLSPAAIPRKNPR